MWFEHITIRSEIAELLHDDWNPAGDDYSSIIYRYVNHYRNCPYHVRFGRDVLYIKKQAKIHFEEFKPKDWSTDKFLDELLAIYEKQKSSWSDQNEEN